MNDDRTRSAIERTLGVNKRGKRGLRWLVSFVILAAAGVSVSQYFRQQAEASAPKYVLGRAERGDLTVTVSATGSLRSLSTVEVGAEVSGRVTDVHVTYNDRVEKGQLLAEIDVEQLQASLDESSARVSGSAASIQTAEATLVEARAALARAEAQAKEGLTTQRELETARATEERAAAALVAARAEARVARAVAQSAHSKLKKARIVSPITGVVLSRLIEPGQTVTAGFQTPVLFRIAEDLRKMALHVYVDEADVGRVRENLTASFSVDAYPGKVFPSRVLSIRNEPKTEQNVVTYEAVLAADNSELLLRPGMTANAMIVAETRRDTLLVPNAALRFSPPETIPTFRRPVARVAQGPRVWVLNGGAPEPVPVKQGPTDGVKTEIVQGLKQGASVIVDVAEP